MILEWYEQQVQQKYYMRDIFNQLARSATSVGANISEVRFAQSDADYKSKLSIALKEAGETRYWIKHLSTRGFIDKALVAELSDRLESIINILVSIIKKKTD